MAFRSVGSLTGHVRRLLWKSSRRGLTWLKQSRHSNNADSRGLGHPPTCPDGGYGYSAPPSLHGTWHSHVMGRSHFLVGASAGEKCLVRGSAVGIHRPLQSLLRSNDPSLFRGVEPSVGTTTTWEPRRFYSLYGRGDVISPASQTVPGQTRGMSKRPKKYEGKPEAWVKVAPDQPCPPYQPNEGSMKNRNHKHRMALRALFAKNQVQLQIQRKKEALAKRDADRKKRWKEGAQRAKAWSELVASRTAAASGTDVLQ